MARVEIAGFAGHTPAGVLDHRQGAARIPPAPFEQARPRDGDAHIVGDA